MKKKQKKHKLILFSNHILVKKDLIEIKRGDYVRIRLDYFVENRKNKFEKKYVPNFTKEIYQVKSVSRDPKNPQYTLIDEKGTKINNKFFNDDLLLIDKNKLIKPIKGNKRIETGLSGNTIIRKRLIN